MAGMLNAGIKIAEQVHRTIGKTKVADIELDHSMKKVDMEGSGPGAPGSGDGATGVFGADALSNNRGGRHMMVKKRMYRFRIPEGDSKSLPDDGKILAGENQNSGWFIFPWQNFFQKSIKPRDFVGLNNLAKRWRVVKTVVRIDNITPEMHYNTQTSSSMQFPNVYFEMYEDEAGDLNGYNANWSAYDSGVQSYERSSGKLDLKTWNYCFDAGCCSSLSSANKYYFQAADMNLYNGSGVSFGRQVDAITREWVNPDKHWRHSHAPLQSQKARINVQATNAAGAESESAHEMAQTNVTPYGVGQVGFGGIPFQINAQRADTNQPTGKRYPEMDADQLHGEANISLGRAVGRQPLHTNSGVESQQHIGTSMMDYMTGLPVFVQPPPLWLMRAVDYSDQFNSSWTFNATFETFIEWDDNELGYWPLDYSNKNLGWCGTNAFGFITQPQVQIADGAAFAKGTSGVVGVPWGNGKYEPNYAGGFVPENPTGLGERKRPRVDVNIPSTSSSQTSPVTPCCD